MDVTQILERDHRKVSALFERLGKAKSPAVQAKLFEQIRFELEVHADAEEEVLYPRVATIKDMAPIETHSEKEHAEVRKLLVKAAASGPERAPWKELIRNLKESVEHHVEEEESELFPKMREHFTEVFLAEMGRELAATKKRNKARPASRRAA